MKKLTLLLSALMIAGVTFAHEGKSCCKDKKEKCTKESACCKDKAHCKKECAKEASSKDTKTSKSTTPPSPKA